MLKRILLFLLMNIAVIALITIVFAVLERFFGIRLDLYGFNYVSIWIYSAIIWFSWAFISLFLSKWMAKKAYWITIIDQSEVYNLSDKQKVVWDVVKELSERNNINMPEVGIYESPEPNAFATWASKNSSLVAVSTGLLEIMDKNAIEWVIGHEMAHILNWDMVTMTLLQWVLNTFVVFLARIITNLIASRFNEWLSTIVYFLIDILLQILFWLFASLIAMKFSRYREFKADEWSARFLWKEKMIAWLQALKRMQNLAPKDEWTFATMQISTRTKWWIMSLFSSHPDLDDRIKALEDLRI